MTESAADRPVDVADAFARLKTVQCPSIDDLKMVVMLEAAGQSFYEGLAGATSNEALKAVFLRNGREETGHAHRVRRVIKMLYDEDVPMPDLESNPFYRPPTPGVVLDKATLSAIVEGEAESDVFYQGWADNIGNAKASKLLRQNGKEEAKHGVRVAEAIALLAH